MMTFSGCDFSVHFPPTLTVRDARRRTRKTRQSVRVLTILHRDGNHAKSASHNANLLIQLETIGYGLYCGCVVGEGLSVQKIPFEQDGGLGAALRTM
jgi:hypothetical protein